MMKLVLLFNFYCVLAFDNGTAAAAAAAAESVRVKPVEERVLLKIGNVDIRVSPHRSAIHGGATQRLRVVCTQFDVHKIIRLDPKTQQLDVLVLISIFWYDRRLSWVDDHVLSGIRQLRMPAKNVWLPDISLINGVGNQVPFDDPIEHDDKFVTVQSDGRVEYTLHIEINSVCPVDARMFPFDHQTCNLTFASWTAASIQFIMERESSVTTSQEFYGDSEWLVDRATSYPATLNSSTPQLSLTGQNRSEEKRVGIVVSLYVHRKSHHYLYTVFVPVTMLTILTLANIQIPSNCFRDKIIMSLSIFMAESWYLIMVAPHLPVTRIYLPIIGVCVVLSMVFSCVTLIVSIVVIHIHLQTARVRASPPTWLLQFCSNVLGSTRIKSLKLQNLNAPTNEEVSVAHENHCSVLASCSCMQPAGSSNLLRANNRLGVHRHTISNGSRQTHSLQPEKHGCRLKSTCAENWINMENIQDSHNKRFNNSNEQLLSETSASNGRVKVLLDQCNLSFSLDEAIALDPTDDVLTDSHTAAAKPISSADGRPQAISGQKNVELSSHSLSHLLFMHHILQKKKKRDTKFHGRSKTNEWQIIAMTVDTIFFWVSLCLVIFGVLMLAMLNHV